MHRIAGGPAVTEGQRVIFTFVMVVTACGFWASALMDFQHRHYGMGGVALAGGAALLAILCCGRFL